MLAFICPSFTISSWQMNFDCTGILPLIDSGELLVASTHNMKYSLYQKSSRTVFISFLCEK